MKTYLKLNFPKDPVLYPGVYRFEDKLSYEGFLKAISVPPKPIMVKVTLLEGRSSRDYDALLSKKGYAAPKAYRDYITNADTDTTCASRAARMRSAACCATGC